MDVPRWAWKAFRQGVGDVVGAGALDQDHDPVRHEVAHVVASHVDVPSELAVHWVQRDLDAHCVVLPHCRRPELLVSEAAEDRMQIHHLLSCHRRCNILSLCRA
eukprot:3584502-Rhodomonas_salina.1